MRAVVVYNVVSRWREQCEPGENSPTGSNEFPLSTNTDFKPILIVCTYIYMGMEWNIRGRVHKFVTLFHFWHGATYTVELVNGSPGIVLWESPCAVS